jgi:transcriptional regulator with GAF, ATPase, and Fis domain
MSNRPTADAADEAFAELSRIVLGEQPLPEILERVVQIAKRVLPVPTEASITLITGDDPATVASTDEVAIALDERQYTRWPRYAESAVDRGVRSSMSVPLPIQRNVMGALNFYATDSAVFEDNVVELAETFAGHAAVAVANAHLFETTVTLADQMHRAMASRAVIEQAKGIIMRDRGCSPDEAFNALVRLSQQSHLKLRDVAERLVDQVATSGSGREDVAD